MNWLDLVIVAVIAWSAFSAFRAGLIRQVVALLSMVIGGVVAGQLYDRLSSNIDFLIGDPSLRQIPVVVLSTSMAVEDIRRSYDLHANVYVAKPVDFDDFAGVVRQIDGFFGSVAELPPR